MEKPEAWRRWLIHALGLLLLMWPAIVNRQPFFFPDTTSYVRAADLAVRLATREAVTTAWTNNDPTPADRAKDSAPAIRKPHGSDGRDGNPVMSGRSPYFGALLYVGWVTSGFWLFVVAQALIGWWLIGLALRCFSITSIKTRLIVTASLGLLTSLPFYTGLLLADDLAALGLLAFVILTTDPPDLRIWERIGLCLVLLASVASHLTHIVMTVAMIGVLLLYLLFKRRRWAELRKPVAVGVIAATLGLASVAVTGLVVKQALGKPPALAPLFSARFIIDGPGRDYIASGCGGHHFAVCDITSDATDSDVWLWSWRPGTGGFLTQDAETRAALSREDKAFAIAVLKTYPLRQGGMLALNTVKQLAEFRNVILSESAMADYQASGIVLPAAVRERMQASPAGRDAWPVTLFDIVHYLTVLAALAALAVATPKLLREQPEHGRRLLLWIALIGCAMLANAFFGGGISAPQGRYQARIVWLIPLLAMIAIARIRATLLPASATTR